jgi:methionine sulfoxide reductase heme-binding subunit
MTRPRDQWLQRVGFVLALLPALWIGADALRGHLGANPIAAVLNRLGYWTLVLLLLSLACTPARIILRRGWPMKLRRTWGLFAFAYGLAHFLFYVGVDQFFDLHTIYQDVVRRKFMTVGFAALCLLVPLALTSTKKSIRRLGARRWTRLHRLVYPAAVLGVIHFIWRVKADRREPLIFAAVLLVLFAVRVVDAVLSANRAARGSDGSRSRTAAHRTR